MGGDSMKTDQRDAYRVDQLMDTSMSYVKRNEFLARAIGYTYIAPSGLAQSPNNKGLTTIPDFSTPDGFFKLWDWAQKQEWFELFRNTEMMSMHLIKGFSWVNPDKFADTVYEFLRKETV